MLAVLLLWDPVFNWSISLAGHLAAFFIAAMICQTLLYRARPQAASLTQFYAWMSLGGVLGGIFAAIIAPQIFNSVLEYPLLIVAAFALRPDVRASFKAVWRKEVLLVLGTAIVAGAAYFIMEARSADAGLKFYATVAIVATAALPFLVRRPVRLLGFATVLVLVTGIFPPGQDIVYRGRSFFGVYKVLAADSGTYHLFFHGTTTHGAEQMLANGKPLTGIPEPLAYYHRGGGLGEAIEKVRATRPLHRAAVVGLGIGALSCYVRPGENWTFYELDPLVVRIARNRNLFRSFSMCAANSPVVIGDARLTLHKSAPGLDLLVMDAFTSDSVPVHLLTKEAFALYRAKLSPHGIIVFHVSNRNLELSDVVAQSAAANGMVTALHPSVARSTDLPYRFASEVVIVAQSPADLASLHLGRDWNSLPPRGEIWTDDYSDVLGALLKRLAN